MAKPIHAMLRVLAEERSVAFYQQAFAMRVADRYAFDSFTLIYLVSDESPFELELTVNHDQTEPYSLGNGYGHMAFSVSDLDAEHHRFEAAGLSPKPIKEFHRDGGLMARFFFVADPDGYQIEVLQRHGRFK